MSRSVVLSTIDKLDRLLSEESGHSSGGSMVGGGGRGRRRMGYGGVTVPFYGRGLYDSPAPFGMGCDMGNGSYVAGGYIPLNCRPQRQAYVTCRRQNGKPQFGMIDPAHLQRMQNGSFVFRQWLNATGNRLGNFQPASQYYNPDVVRDWLDYKAAQPGFQLAPRGRVVPRVLTNVNPAYQEGIL